MPVLIPGVLSNGCSSFKLHIQAIRSPIDSQRYLKSKIFSSPLPLTPSWSHHFFFTWISKCLLTGLLAFTTHISQSQPSSQSNPVKTQSDHITPQWFRVKAKSTPGSAGLYTGLLVPLISLTLYPLVSLSWCNGLSTVFLFILGTSHLSTLLFPLAGAPCPQIAILQVFDHRSSSWWVFPDHTFKHDTPNSGLLWPSFLPYFSP